MLTLLGALQTCPHSCPTPLDFSDLSLQESGPTCTHGLNSKGKNTQLLSQRNEPAALLAANVEDNSFEKGGLREHSVQLGLILLLQLLQKHCFLQHFLGTYARQKDLWNYWRHLQWITDSEGHKIVINFNQSVRVAETTVLRKRRREGGRKPCRIIAR